MAPITARETEARASSNKTASVAGDEGCRDVKDQSLFSGLQRRLELTVRFHLTSPAPAAPSTAVSFFLAPPTPPTRCPYALSFLVILP